MRYIYNLTVYVYLYIFIFIFIFISKIYVMHIVIFIFIPKILRDDPVLLIFFPDFVYFCLSATHWETVFFYLCSCSLHMRLYSFKKSCIFKWTWQRLKKKSIEIKIKNLDSNDVDIDRLFRDTCLVLKPFLYKIYRICCIYHL